MTSVSHSLEPFPAARVFLCDTDGAPAAGNWQSLFLLPPLWQSLFPLPVFSCGGERLLQQNITLLKIAVLMGGTAWVRRELCSPHLSGIF